MKPQQPSRYNPTSMSLVSAAPPLDFSFRSITKLEEILTMNPQTGTRRPIVIPCQQDSKNIKTEQSKSNQQVKVQQPLQEQPVQKHVETRLQIVRTVDVNSVFNQVNQTTFTTKTNHQPAKPVKRTKQVELISTTIYLSYNKLRSIKQFYPVVDSVFVCIANLKWIDISHNLLVVLDYNFKELPQLKSLYLHCNYIKDFAELSKLESLKELKTFTIHGNPLDLHPQFRNLVIGLLPCINKIDSVLVTRRQHQTATHMMKSLNPKRIPVILNAASPPESSDQEDN